MVTVEQVQAELFALQMEKHKALVKERNAARKELIRNMGIVSRKFFAPAPPKQPTPIAQERAKRRKEKQRLAELNRKAQLTLFTQRQMELGAKILERMENPK